MVFIRMQRDGSGSASAAVIGALDAVFDPGAARAREERQAQNERVVAVPSPGDRLLTDGVVVITAPSPERAPAPAADADADGS